MSSPSEFILASGSSRRRDLLKQDGWRFRIVVSDVEEQKNGVQPEQLVTLNAQSKAKAVAEQHPDALVLGSDTTVGLGNTIFNKPADLDEAREMLRKLSGQTHHVHTAFVIVYKAGGIEELQVISNEVRFKPLAESTIDTYLDRVHTLDKAGGYAIQERGDLIIDTYEDPLSNIIGLPIEAVNERLETLGFDKLFRS